MRSHRRWNNSNLWEWSAWISSMTMPFHHFVWMYLNLFDDNAFPSLHCQKHFLLFNNNVFRFQRYHRICIISGFYALRSLHCQSYWYLRWWCIFISWMTTYLNFFIDNARPVLWCHGWFSLWVSSPKSFQYHRIFISCMPMYIYLFTDKWSAVFWNVLFHQVDFLWAMKWWQCFSISSGDNAIISVNCQK